MKINPNIEETQGGKSLKKASAVQVGAAPEKNVGQPVSLSSGEKTSLSGLAKDLSKSEAPINEKKVGQLKEAISRGEFKINPEKIADGVIKSSLELLGKA
ncbi:MAG: flagellar biosynthesis anti-sigma factor FlgM [Burkholderiaceae bacterium]